MSNITTIELEKLTVATEAQLNKFYNTDNHDEANTAIITDAYGFEKSVKDVICHGGYLLPKAKISPEVFSSNYSITTENYADYKLKYEWIKLSGLRIRHISDFKVCFSTGLMFPCDKLRKLDGLFYDEDTYAHKNYVSDSGYDDYILTQDAVDVVSRYEKYHSSDEDLIYSEHHDQYVHLNDVVYPDDDPDTPYHEDSCYCRDDIWYTSQDVAEEGCIREYHCTPAGNHYLKDDDTDILSKFTIGFEVEKTSVNDCTEQGEHVGDEPLFAGWETDSSCGVEGITHVYGLNNLDEFSNHVKYSSYTDEPTTSRCGGHINICDTTHTVKYWHIKSWCGLWWAMYRRRLRNDYSGGNKKVCPYESRGGQRYQAIREKSIGNGKLLFELRLPNRVRDGEQLIRRFKLSQTWMKCIYAFATEDWSYSTKKYADAVRGMPNWAYDDASKAERELTNIAEMMPHVPLTIYNRMRFLIEESKAELLESYENNEAGLMHVIQLTYAFQVYIENEPYKRLPDCISSPINQYL